MIIPLAYLIVSLITFFDLFGSTSAAGSTQTYWNNYLACSRQCKIDVYESGVSGCQLTNSCLCKTKLWLEAWARCVKERCGPEDIAVTAHETARSCFLTGYPMIISELQFIQAGYGDTNTAETVTLTVTATSVVTSVPTIIMSSGDIGGNSGGDNSKPTRSSYLNAIF